MRTALPLLFVVVLGCGPAEPMAEPPQQVQESQPTLTQPAKQFRLTSSFQSRDGFRFSDGALLTTSGFDPIDQTINLLARSDRSFSIYAPQGALCPTRTPALSLAEVLEADCDGWSSDVYLWVRFQQPEPRVNRGVILRTSNDGEHSAYRLRVLEIGFEAATQTESVLFEYEPYPLSEEGRR